MLMRDFHVQGVELRGLFLAQLPQRLARLASRGDRLHREGWDINTLYLLADDAATLASACRDLDASDLADCLQALSETVAPLFDPPRVPDSAIGARIASLLREIKDKPLPVAVRTTAAQAGVVVPGPIQDQGFPLLVIPPAEYWLRFGGTSARVRLPEADVETSDIENLKPVSDAAAVSSAVSAGAEPAIVADAEIAPTAAAPIRHAAPSHKTAYHLGRAEPPAAEIDRYLSAQGYQLTSFDSVDELKELLVALPPHLVIVDAAFAERNRRDRRAGQARARGGQRAHLADRAVGRQRTAQAPARGACGLRCVHCIAGESCRCDHAHRRADRNRTHQPVSHHDRRRRSLADAVRRIDPAQGRHGNACDQRRFVGAR